MLPRLALLATLAWACAGANAAAVRARGARGDLLVLRDPARATIEPKTNAAMLANPLECLGIVRGSDAGAVLARMIVVPACAVVVGAVDLVALPVQLAMRSHQRTQIGEIAAGCQLRDPVVEIGERAAQGLGARFGFIRPADGRDAAESVTLQVTTGRFTWSGRMTWWGELVLHDREGKVIWKHACAVDGPDREPRDYVASCETARRDSEDLAGQCAAAFLAALEPAPPSANDPSGAW